MSGLVLPGGGGGGAPSGAAGGALGGSYPNPTLAAGTVTSGGLVWDGANWVNANLGDANIATGAAINPAKINGTAVVTADSRLSNARTPTAHAASHAQSGTDALDWVRGNAITPLTDPWFPTGIPGAATPKVANMQRREATNNSALLTSAKLYLVAMTVWPGLVINGFAMCAGTQTAVSPLNQWMNLVEPATLTQLQISADDTVNAWNASNWKPFTLASPYTVTAGVWALYAGVMVKATTPPSFLGGATGQVTVQQTAPQMTAGSTTGLTNPASSTSPVSALTAGLGVPYVVIW